MYIIVYYLIDFMLFIIITWWKILIYILGQFGHFNSFVPSCPAYQTQNRQLVVSCSSRTKLRTDNKSSSFLSCQSCPIQSSLHTKRYLNVQFENEREPITDLWSQRRDGFCSDESFQNGFFFIDSLFLLGILWLHFPFLLQHPFVKLALLIQWYWFE